ncbi:hypothetical protein APN06_25050, partial [Salmonella enterica subsp. enterica serovar Typhimurium var. 5-]|nr:hypothetical protein [Salmonella enterica subsp. enterica serovar Typhimurium var. 5-]
QPAIVQKQRMAKLRAPQRPMTAGFASVKGKVSISFTAPVFMLELFSGGRVVINDCVFALLGYEYVIWRGCVFRTNEKQVTHFAQTL